MLRLRAASAAPFFLITLASVGDALAKDPDPAARGLDLFVHAPKTVRAGDTASLDLLAYGFVAVTDPRPLEKASILATWDPESLGAGVMTAPGDVSVTTDGAGHATLQVPMPDGDARTLTLLIALRHGEHVRTRKVQIARSPKNVVALRVTDTHVVPGSQVPVWITVTDARTGSVVKSATVDVALREGEISRATDRVTTDASGIARATVYVPPGVTGTPALALRARLPTSNSGFVEQSMSLSLREEQPATPMMRARWTDYQLKPGETGHAEVTLTDAAGDPIANHSVRYWIGPKGTTPPKTDDEWKQQSKTATTDGLGLIALTFQAPRVVTSLGSDLTLVAKTELEEREVSVTDRVAVGQPTDTAELSIESGDLVPGAKQRAYLHVQAGSGPAVGTFIVEADGLKANVTTDADGDGELTWNVPGDVGAKRDNGPCAGGVAAAVTIRQATPIAALAKHPEPFETCVSVARDRTTLLRPSVYVARVGDKPKLTLQGAKKAAGSITVVGKDETGFAVWSPNDEATLDLTNVTPGLKDVTFAVPSPNAASVLSQTRMLVVPKLLPKVTATLAAGSKLLPGSDVDVDVTLDDGHGHPVAGAITGIVIDKNGGGRIDDLERLDTRLGLCFEAGATRSRCDAFLEDAADTEVFRRVVLGTEKPKPLAPELDPAANSKKELNDTFSAVLHSLEGAVYQSNSPESLRDVRRKVNGRWGFNPELMTLVTAAMGDAPETPGGDPFGLGDLIAVDPQVTFDAVARRVTRLKLFNVLKEIRSWAEAEQVTPEEPVTKDPNAVLRRLIRDGKLSKEQLMDPWGNSLQFVHANGPSVPFLTVLHGWELHSPGPDGQLGTADDVKDPFERVVKSGSPYAEAMDEDEIVDARLDMRVGDATVTNWDSMFQRLTGTQLGLGLSGIGEGGGGSGFGNGHGRLGGSHTSRSPQMRLGFGIATDNAHWTEPVRTDANGHARIRVHLGDYETTWQVAFLARTDGGQSAVTSVDAPVSLPVSAHVDLGRKLIAGDSVAARILVRNRTSTPKPVTLELGAEGGLVVAKDQPHVISVDVPANSARAVFARFSAPTEGVGRAIVTLRAPGTEGDRSSDEVAIDPAGQPLVITNGVEATTRAKLKVPVPPGWALRGTPRVVVESGFRGALVDALASYEPSPTTPPDALADAVEVAARIEKLAESQSDKTLAAHAREVAALARTYLELVPTHPQPLLRLAWSHALLYPAPDEDSKPGSEPTRLAKFKALPDGQCPKSGDIDSIGVPMLLEAEPTPTADGPLSCFTQLMAKIPTKTPLDLARATMALAERPHRAVLTDAFAHDLAKATSADGKRAPIVDGTRSEKATILAALARTAPIWSKDPNEGQKLAQTILTLRDARGGYGSSEATRDVVRAFAALETTFPPKAARVTVNDGTSKHTVDVAAGATTVIALAPGATAAGVDVSGGAVAVRLERPVLRRFDAPADSGPKPITVGIDWPTDAKAGTTGIVHVSYTENSSHGVDVTTRIPLPPGVELAAPVEGVSIRQGVIYVTKSVGTTETVSLPVRFGLPGTMWIPEAETETTSEERPRTLSPARWLTVQ